MIGPNVQESFEDKKMEVSTYKGSVILDKELEDELMKFTMKSENSEAQKGYSVKPAEEVQKNTDVEMEVEVNITECTKSTGNIAAPPEYQDLTESEGSSSFEENESDFDDTLDGFEASSDLSSDFDGFGDNFRKKKPTSHWRSFIQPIMWRCKWTELQIKKLQSIAQQYDRELEAHKNQKQVQIVDSELIDGVKSLPFSCTNTRSDFIRRKKRKTTEASTDVAAYMSCHNLFSYFENKRNLTEGPAMSNLPKISDKGTQKANADDDFWANDNLSSFVAEDGNDSLEDILRKIGHLQSQAGQLRSRVDRVISENAEKFFSTNNLSLPIPPFNNGDGVDVGTYIASQLMSEQNTPNDELVLESAVTNHRDGGSSNPDANADHVEDGALIDNQIVKEEMTNFDEVIINPIQKQDISVDTDEPDLPTADQPLSETRSIARITGPRSNRKRGKKKGGRRRTRRSSG